MSPIGEKAAIAIVFLLAGSAAGVGLERLYGRIGHGDSPSGASRNSDATRRMRVELESARAENDALRSELDRLVEGRRRSEWLAADHARESHPERADTAAPTDSLHGIAERYRDALARASSGDTAASDEAYEAALRLFRAGPEAFPALRDAYLSTDDPRVRAVMVRAFGAGLGREAAEFIAEQLRTETDGSVRMELLERASRMSTPTTAPLFRDAFLRIVTSDADVESRIDALGGLRYLRDDHDVDRALVVAATDSSEGVRVAAIEAIATRPELRDELERLIANDPSDHVRRIGECRLLLTGSRASL